MSCICQQCGNEYRIDLLVPDDIWEKIKHIDKPKEAGLLCGMCIMDQLESFNTYGAINANIDFLNY